MRRIFLLLLVLLPSILFAFTPDPALEREIVIYQRGFAEIIETRELQIEKGENEIILPRISPFIFTETLMLEVIDGNGVESYSVNYADTYLNNETYWQEQIGTEVTLFLNDETFHEGILESMDSAYYYLRKEDGIYPVDKSYVEFPEVIDMPRGLVPGPSLRWTCKSKKEQAVKVKISYFTENIDWTANFKSEIEGDNLSLKASFMIDNTTGLQLPADKLILIAGGLHLAGDKRSVDRLNPLPGASNIKEESDYGEVQRYVIDRKTVLYDGESKLIPFLNTDAIKFERKYVYDATIFDDRVTSFCEFSAPVSLPYGDIRIYEKIGKQSLMVGEDRIDDSPSGSLIKLTIAQSFDYTAERKRVSSGRDDVGHPLESFEITLGNSTGLNQTIEVIERVFGIWDIQNVKVDGKDIIATKPEARTASMNVIVPAGKTAKLTYDIIYMR